VTPTGRRKVACIGGGGTKLSKEESFNAQRCTYLTDPARPLWPNLSRHEQHAGRVFYACT